MNEKQTEGGRGKRLHIWYNDRVQSLELFNSDETRWYIGNTIIKSVIKHMERLLARFYDELTESEADWDMKLKVDWDRQFAEWLKKQDE